MYAVLAAIAFGFWTVFHKLASPYINQVFGAILVSFTAVIAGLVVLLPQIRETQLVTNSKGIYFIIGAGICAFLIDFLALNAYAKGLSVNVGGPIIIGGSIAVAGLIGFLMGDPITFVKLAGIGLVILGSVVLSLATA